MRRVLIGTLFYPRGGSAFVVRALARGLSGAGWGVTVLSGSRSDDRNADAARFYAGCDVRAVDFAPALATAEPLQFDARPGSAPVHPSYEDRPGAPDRVFASIDDLTFERQVRAWSSELARAGGAEADVLYLHHLTPLYAAAARVAPDTPIVGHLHGTELLMLERIEPGAPAGWPYAERWQRRLRAWADGCQALIVAPGGGDRAASLLEVARDRLVELPNGFDPRLFAPLPVDRTAVWRRVLVQEPRGWLPDRGPGSVRYADVDVARLARGPVLLFVGRFTEVKRLDMLIAAFAGACDRFARPASLVIVGGHPGEWEGEHPAQTIARLGVDGVFLAGWHSHEELPELLSAADVLVMPSSRESFGQVIVEAMACGLPALATRSPGPETIVDDGRTGWLVDVDDERALGDALVAAVNDPRERRRRARAALQEAAGHYAWPAIAGRLSDLLASTADWSRGTARLSGGRGSPSRTIRGGVNR